MKAQGARMAEEERRKTLDKETEHAKARAQYQDQLGKFVEFLIDLKQVFSEKASRRGIENEGSNASREFT